MSDATLDIIVRLKDLFSRPLNSIATNTGRVAQQMQSSWDRFSTGIMAAKIAVAGWVTGQVAQFVREQAELAAKIDLTGTAFGSMAKKINVDVTSALERMRTASKNTVTDLDLMSSANRAIMLGAVQSADELEKLVYYGTKLGNAMGLTAAQGIDYFTTGLARQSNAILDNVGLIVDIEGAYKRLGVTADKLTEDERRSIFAAEVWRSAAEKAKQLGGNIAEVATNVARMGAAFQSAKNKAAEFFGQMFEPVGERGESRLEWWARRISPLYAGYTAYSEAKTQIEQQKNLKARAEAARKRQASLAPPGISEEAWTRISSFTPTAETWQRIQTQQSLEESQAYRDAFEGKYAQEVFHQHVEDNPMVIQARAVWKAMGEGAKDYYKAVSQTMLDIQDTVTRSFQNIEDAIASVFFDTMMGKMQSFKAYLRAFLQDIARTISQFFARQAMKQIIELGGAAISSLFSSPTAGDIDTRLGPSDFGNQKIGVAQTGGITRGLTIAGEAGPEAVVPLPGNRHIPVDLRGSSGRTNVFVFQVQALDAPSVQRLFYEQGGTLAKVLQDRLSTDMQLRAVVRAV